MDFSPFSCPIFLGHARARGRCSQSERLLYGRDLCCSGRNGKAEAAKLQGAGIGPKPCPGKCAGKKGELAESSGKDGKSGRGGKRADRRGAEAVTKDSEAGL